MMIDMTRAGWSGSFDKLAEVLEEEKPGAPKTRLIAEPGKQEASIVRIFDAPREKCLQGLYRSPVSWPNGGHQEGLPSSWKRWT